MQDNNNLDKNNEEEKTENTAETFDSFDTEDDFDIPSPSEEEIIDSEDIAEETDENDSIDENQEEIISEAEEEKKEKKIADSKKFKEFLLKIRMPLIIVLLVIICTFIAFFAYAYSTINADKVMNNVFIENLDVGGLSYDETLDAINATYLFEKSNISLSCGEQTFDISGSDIGLSARPEDTAKKAFEYSKNGNFLTNGFNAMKLLFKKHIIIPAAQVDDAMLDAKLNEFGNIVLGQRKQHYVELGDDGMVTIFSGTTGYDENPATAHEQVLTALDMEDFTNIHVDFSPAPPDPMTVESLDALVYKDAVDAKYEVVDNTVNIIPGDTGRYINKEEAAEVVPNVYEGCEPVRLPFYVSTPAKDVQMLKDKLFETTLGSYSTSYGSSSSNRCANIARAASLINGKILAPGEVFSFNDTVGHRTAANGFYSAKEYVDGQSVDGIGGGTCQVSSTLYSAVLYADMGIVERLNHMLTVGYIPLGQDATVSDGGVDFQFKNTSDYPVKVSAYTSGATITVSIIGTAWEPARTVKITNSTSKSGENTVVQSTRLVYANDQLIDKETLNSSTYMPHKSAN